MFIKTAYVHVPTIWTFEPIWIRYGRAYLAELLSLNTSEITNAYSLTRKNQITLPGVLFGFKYQAVTDLTFKMMSETFLLHTYLRQTDILSGKQLCQKLFCFPSENVSMAL